MFQFYCLASLARLDPEPYNQYTVKYIGNCTVLRPTGIDIVRDAIGKLVTIHSENQWVEGQALISATTVKHQNHRFYRKKCKVMTVLTYRFDMLIEFI